jgi:hypothetical protein
LCRTARRLLRLALVFLNFFLFSGIARLLMIDDDAALDGRPPADVDELRARRYVLRAHVVQALHGVVMALSRLDGDEDLPGLIE